MNPDIASIINGNDPLEPEFWIYKSSSVGYTTCMLPALLAQFYGGLGSFPGGGAGAGLGRPRVDQVLHCEK